MSHSRSVEFYMSLSPFRTAEAASPPTPTAATLARGESQMTRLQSYFSDTESEVGAPHPPCPTTWGYTVGAVFTLHLISS
eukprot:4718776-Amphidinium_carterae.1